MTTHLRRATVYFPETRGPAIVAAMHFNAAGVYFEQDQPIAIDDWRSPEKLVTALRSALERFSFRERNLRGAKTTDWPSYRASGLDSVGRFERSYLAVGVCAVNEAELLYDASAKPRGEADISLYVKSPCYERRIRAALA